MVAIGSNPAIMTPAPNAMPATGAVTPAPLPKSKTALPTKLAADPTTKRTPITHMRIFSARGFHFATTCLPPFDRWVIWNLSAERRPFQVQLIDGVHAFSNHLLRKYLRTSQPHGFRFEAVGPRESTLVLGFPQHQVGQLVGSDHAAI